MGQERPSARFYQYFGSDELLFDMLLECAKQGRSDRTQWWSRRRCPKQVVQVIFDVCAMLDVGHLEKYAAVELFERFLELHVKAVRSDLEKGDFTQEIRGLTRSNMQKQMVLRLVTCVIIVHKFYCSCFRNHRKIKDFMAKSLSIVRVVSPKCTSEILVRSEFRVLQTIDYRVEKPMPLPHLQIISEVVMRNRPGQAIPPQALSHAVYLVCDCYYLNREFFHRRIRSMDGTDSIKDYLMLLSAAIIATTAFIFLDQERRDNVSEELAFLTTVPLKHILDLRDSFLLIICNRIPCQ